MYLIIFNELQQALAANKPVTFVKLKEQVKESIASKYIRSGTKYLYFFDVEFDQKEISYTRKQIFIRLRNNYIYRKFPAVNRNVYFLKLIDLHYRKTIH